MKVHNKHDRVIATAGARLLSKVIFPAKALHFGCAAQRDERNGFPYTAALDWRHAAELVPNTLAAEYFWQQWERVMHLPRRMATPFGVSQVIALPAKVSSAARPGTQRVESQPTAA